MATFKYKARDKSGEILSGSQEASSEDTLITSLKGKGLLVLDINKTKDDKETGLHRNIALFDRIGARDMVVFTRQFATLR